MGGQAQFVFAVVAVCLFKAVAVDFGRAVAAVVDVADGVFGGECDASDGEGFGDVESCLVGGKGVGGAVDVGTVKGVVGGGQAVQAGADVGGDLESCDGQADAALDAECGDVAGEGLGLAADAVAALGVACVGGDEDAVVEAVFAVQAT